MRTPNRWVWGLLAILGVGCGDDAPEAVDDRRDAAADSGTVEPDDGDAPPAPRDAGSQDAGEYAGDDAGDDATNDAGDAQDAAPPGPDWARLVERGDAAVTTSARPTFGALLTASQGNLRVAVESRRDVEPGPYGVPWRSRFRMVAYDGELERWSFEAEVDDALGDVVVHPSGEVTCALQRFDVERHAYSLLRFSAAGELLHEHVLDEPAGIPESDFRPSDPRPLVRMAAPLFDATTPGWLRLIADGEHVLASFLSFVDVGPEHMLRTRYVLGVARFEHADGVFSERWARLVEGPHTAQPAAWAYDELRWRDQAERPFFARDPQTGELFVGRAWNTSRCNDNVTRFGEFDADACRSDAVNVVENERLPLAVTRFSESGVRRGTRVLRPDDDAVEQVPFDLLAQDGALVVVGSVVRALADGSRRMAGSAVDYDGYLAVYGLDGARLRSRDVNTGTGDVLAALRAVDGGVLAVGSSGWVRGLGGMSILHGADPLLAWFPEDDGAPITRVVPLSDGTRHYTLHDVTPDGDGFSAVGFADAPMTHSADNGNDAARTFAGLRIHVH